MTLTPIVQQIYACFGQGDVPGILEKLDDNVRWEEWADNSAQKSDVPWMQAQQGKAGAMAFFQCIGTLMQVKDFQVLSIMEGGNQVVAEVTIKADLPSLGNQFQDEELHLWTFNDAGKVTRFRHYLDTHKHIKAAVSA